MAAIEHAGGGVNAADLVSFEKEVATAIDAGRVPGPTHLSGGNEDQLIDVFKEIGREDWVLSTWRSHYHALLHGVPRELVMERILAGRSMNLAFTQHRFLTSAIVGGMLSIAVGIASALKHRGEERKVFCFVGDMAASTGMFADAQRYVAGHALPVVFVVEDNGFSTDTPTDSCWAAPGVVPRQGLKYTYEYQRIYPHIGTRSRGTL